MDRPGADAACRRAGGGAAPSATAVAAVVADAVDQVSTAFAEAMPRADSMWTIQVVDWEAA